MRISFRTARRFSATACALVATLAVGVLIEFGATPSAVGSARSHHPAVPAPRAAVASSTAPTTASPPTTATPPTTAVPPATAPPAAHIAPAVRAVVAPKPKPVSATGNAQLDALLPTLPPVLFEAGARVHFGYNPLDECCHAGGYNPGPNEVWVSARAFTSRARLVYVTAHELGHSLHLHSARGPALGAAVAGAPVVRAGSPWDVSEKVADCIAWVLYPAQTAAAGITYWGCPDPWRAKVRAALA